MTAHPGLRPFEGEPKGLHTGRGDNRRHAAINTKLINLGQSESDCIRRYPDTMDYDRDAKDRTKHARVAAGFVSGADAARALGVKVTSYNRYENGSSGISRIAPRLAKLFRVELEWLLTGRGPMKKSERIAAPLKIPVTGLVGAGASVEMIGDTSGVDAPDEIEMLGEGRLCALQVRGDSQYPRFMHGEYILYDMVPVTPSSQIGKYAVVQTVDGRRLIKTLQRGQGDSRWTLESHSAPPEKNVMLIAVYRYLGVLPAR